MTYYANSNFFVVRLGGKNLLVECPSGVDFEQMNLALKACAEFQDAPRVLCKIPRDSIVFEHISAWPTAGFEDFHTFETLLFSHADPIKIPESLHPFLPKESRWYREFARKTVLPCTEFRDDEWLHDASL